MAMTWFNSLPRWYRRTIAVLFFAYLLGWGYTIHLADVQRADGATFIMPVGPHDSTSYANLSDSILAGHFAEPGEAYEYFHTPGYPVFVAAIRMISGGSFFLVTFIQILLVFAVALITVVLGKKMVSEKIALLASILFLVNPLVPSIALYILTDVLFLFLLTSGILVLLSSWSSPLKRTLLTALIFAAAIYVRPVGFIAFPIFVAPLFALMIPWREKLYRAVLLVVGITILLLPWMARNEAHSGVFSFASLIPLNMAYYNIPHFLSNTTGLPLDEAIALVEKESGVPRGNNAQGYPANWYDLSSAPELLHYERAFLFSHLFSYTAWHLYASLGFFVNPAIVAGSPTTNLKQLLIHGDVAGFLSSVTTPWWLFLERLGVGIGFLLVVVGVWSLRRTRLVWSLTFVILFLAALGGPSAQARYRLPVLPVLSIYIVSGVAALYLWRRGERAGTIATQSRMTKESTSPSVLAWLVRSPLFKGLRGFLGGRLVIRAIEAKRGTILYYSEKGRDTLLDHVRDVKRKTRTLLLDPEAMFLYEAVAALVKVEGDIAEVGTYQGGSARLMAEASEGKKDIHTFDTFEGLPPLESFDAERFHAGQFATPVEAVRAYLAPFPRVHIYQGLFPDTATPIVDKRFSFVHLDVDIYQSTRDGLEFFYPRMNAGGMIVSHDYSNAEGVRRAFAEFFADKPEAVVSLPGTQCFVVKK